MTYRTHEMAGLAITGVTLTLLHKTGLIELNLNNLAPALISTAIASVLPDIDSKESRPRFIINTITCLCILGIIALIYYACKYTIPHQYIDGAFSIIMSQWQIFAIIILIIIGTRSKHRGKTHSILYAGIITGLLYIYTVNWYIALGFFIGMISHDLLDILNRRNVLLFWPLKKGVSLGWFASDGAVSGFIQVTSVLILVVMLLYSFKIIYF